MVLYLCIIGIATALIALFNSIFAVPVYDFGVGYAIFAAIATTLAVIAIDAVVAIIVRLFPAKNFDPHKKIFRSQAWEKNFYLSIGVKAWKDKIPETGKLLVKFSKTEVAQKDNPEYLYKFLTEMGYAEIMHLISTVAGFLVIFIFPLEYALLFGVPAATVNFLLQIPPCIVQRYNRPKVLKLYERSLKQQAERLNTSKEANSENAIPTDSATN